MVANLYANDDVRIFFSTVPNQQSFWKGLNTWFSTQPIRIDVQEGQDPCFM
jgi:hypothetical protein